MTDDSLASVVELACTVEDRDAVEQRALIEVALMLDKRRGRFTVSNRHPVAPRLVELVLEGQKVGLTVSQRKQHEASRLRWVECSCGVLVGAHMIDMVCRPSRLPVQEDE